MKIIPLNQNDHSRQAELTKTLAAASAAYYNGIPSGMSDLEFDRAQEILLKIEAASGFAYEGSPNIAVGARKVTALESAKHEEAALSLDKVKYKDRESLKDWLSEKDGLLSWKMDGLTIVNTYENGELISSVTRGDGETGSVITHNALFFEGLPQKIPYKGKIVVRGEAVMTYEDFEAANEEAGGIYENPRNLAAATVQMLDAEESRKRKIQFYAFKLVEPKPDNELATCIEDGYYFDMSLEEDRFLFMKALGMNVVKYDLVNKNNILETVDEYQKTIKNNIFPTDGLVLSYDNQVFAESLGNTNKHPRGSIALKWTDETKTTTIRDIFWSVGKTGQITPVAVFDPVRLGIGSTVTRASLHNLSIMEKMPHSGELGALGIMSPIQYGSEVEVYMANMIIPQIASSKGGTGKIVIPDTCPVCGRPTHIDQKNGVKVLYCGNADCAARTRGMLENAFSKDGLNIKGIGPSQIEELQQKKLITRYPVELFTLVKQRPNIPEELLNTDGWGVKKWENLVSAVNKARKTTLRRFLYSLSIPLLGNDLSKKLHSYWNGDVEKFIKFVEGPSLEELMSIDGIGPEKASNIVDWCNHTRHDTLKYSMLKCLVEELEFEKPQKSDADSSLQGLTFVITGDVYQYKNRDEFKASVETRGGKVAGSVSKKTTYLVNNDLESMSGKNKKAKELGIPVISEDEFIKKYGK